MASTKTAPRAASAATVPEGARRIARAMSSRGLALFSETIVISLAVAMLAIPAVTALPALAAGGAHFRRHVEGGSDSLAELGRDFLRALRRGWHWGIAAAGGFAAISATLTSPAMEGMPGEDALRWLSGLLGAGAAVVLLRATASWTPSSSWSALVRVAAEASARDVPGSLLLLLALGLTGIIVWMFAPLVVLVPGMLILAARAVVSRSR